MHRGPDGERDVPQDEAVAGSRETGGVPNPEYPDQHTTTGTTSNEEFVGRVTGEDVGSEEETGAERRARRDNGRDGE